MSQIYRIYAWSYPYVCESETGLLLYSNIKCKNKTCKCIEKNKQTKTKNTPPPQKKKLIKKNQKPKQNQKNETNKQNK